MGKRRKSAEPEVYCDLNGRMTDRAYLPTYGTEQDLSALGLTLEKAVGRRFVFYMPDTDESGAADDIMCEGVVVRDQKLGILLEVDAGGFYRRSELE